MAINLDKPAYPDSKDRNSFQSGLEYQDFICDLLRTKLGVVISNYASAKYQIDYGENKQGIEIKLDRLLSKTRRLSIETAEKTRAGNSEFVPSGIYRNDNTWLYIQGNWDVVFIFPKNILRMLAESNKYEKHRIPTLEGFFLPIEHARKYASKYIEISSDK